MAETILLSSTLVLWAKEVGRGTAKGVKTVPCIFHLPHEEVIAGRVIPVPSMIPCCVRPWHSSSNTHRVLWSLSWADIFTQSMGEIRKQETYGQSLHLEWHLGYEWRILKLGSDFQSCCVKAGPIDFTGFLVVYLSNGTNSGIFLDPLSSRTTTQSIQDPQTPHHISLFSPVFI